jgi:predicted Rossmann fold flavoprotein
VIERTDLAVVGAGAAGLTAAIWAARNAPAARVTVLEGARTLGAKILVSGGGRCNVTNESVCADDFCGSSRHAIRKVLSRFDVTRTITFFAELGVGLDRESGGKLFPSTNRARTVLDALLAALSAAGAELRHPARVLSITPADDAFLIAGEWGSLGARRVILATGGRSLPRSGSDGAGYDIARALGHRTSEPITPALVGLRLADGHRLRGIPGLTSPARLTVGSATGRSLASCTGAVLCTHFGVSGPAVLDVSRHWNAVHATSPNARLRCDWLPALAAGDLDAELRAPGAATLLGRLRRWLPERLARALCEEAGIDPSLAVSRLARDARKAVIRAIKELSLPVCGDRGWNFAEVTAGGVPLAELDLASLESRLCPGLHLCGEICDVDGRLGGFNFQWAWASGYVAGCGAASRLLAVPAAAPDSR